jgi:hypothetical protein
MFERPWSDSANEVLHNTLILEVIAEISRTYLLFLRSFSSQLLGFQVRFTSEFGEREREIGSRSGLVEKSVGLFAGEF